MDKHAPALEFAKSAIQNVEQAIRNAKEKLFQKVYNENGDLQISEHIKNPPLIFRLWVEEFKNKGDRENIYKTRVISYYNLGVEYEFLKLYNDSYEAFKKGFELCTRLQNGIAVIKGTIKEVFNIDINLISLLKYSMDKVSQKNKQANKLHLRRSKIRDIHNTRKIFRENNLLLNNIKETTRKPQTAKTTGRSRKEINLSIYNQSFGTNGTSRKIRESLNNTINPIKKEYKNLKL